jgi:prepilin-type N-terminal cleavage/methylation domain-containing protein
MKSAYSMSSRNRGFLLLEMVLALAVFGIAATGFTVALHRMARVASLSQSELRVTRFMESAMNEALSLPVMEEGETEAEIGQAGNVVYFLTVIRLMEDLENQDGEILQQMYHVSVTATWMESGQKQERMVETWRYGRMYQP